MRWILILLVGHPSMGKNHLAELLMRQFTGLEILLPDEIGEEFWGTCGPRNE